MKRITTLIVAAGALAAMALPAVAPAKGGNDDIRRAGECTGGTTSKIKVKPDDGRLEVEFEVDQNQNDVPWRVKIKDNGELVSRSTERTKAPSGSFSIERRISDLAGTDQITATARNKQSGERCAASVSI